MKRLLFILIVIAIGFSARAQSKMTVVVDTIKLIERGNNFLKGENFENAIADYTIVLKKDSSNRLVWFNRGNAFLKRKEYSRALSDYQKSLSLGYTEIGLWSGKAQCNEALGNYKEAIKDYTYIIYAQSWDKVPFYLRGLAKWRLGQNVEAILDFDECLKIDGKYAIALYARGVSFYNSKNYNSAIADFTAAIKLNNSDLAAYFVRGLSFSAALRHAEAIEDFSHVLSIKPSHASSLNDRGLSYYKAGVFDKAIVDLTELVKLSSDNSSAWYHRGVVYEEMGDYPHAIADYTTAVNMKDVSANAWIRRGTVYDMIGEFDKAKGDFKKILTSEPNNKAALYGYARVLDHNGEYSKSIEVFNKLITQSSVSGEVYISLISPLIRLGQYDSAVKCYNIYVNGKMNSFLDDKQWSFYKFFLFAIENDLGQASYTTALSNLDVAINEYGTKLQTKAKYEYLNVLALRAAVLEKLGNIQAAVDGYEQALVINKNQPEILSALQKLRQKVPTASNRNGVAPSVQLFRPSVVDGVVLPPNRETDVIGKVSDFSSGSWLKVNGNKVKIGADGVFVTTARLKDGLNDLVISYPDKDNKTVSKIYKIRGISAQAVVPQIAENSALSGQAPKFYAILIAENNYSDSKIPSLNNPIRDALELKEILEKKYGFLPENIDTLFNSSRDDILTLIMQRCSNNKNVDDNILIFYAGHGTSFRDKFGNDDGYWIPSSGKKGSLSTYISSNDLSVSIKNSESKHILLIADACFSGALTRDLGNDASASIRRQYLSRSRKIMASGNLEPVPDNSVFTFYLKKHLKENRSKYLTAQDLFQGFRPAVLNNSKTVPQYSAIRNVGDEGGEFVFILSER